MLDVRKICEGMMEQFDLECIDLGHIVTQGIGILKPLADLSDICLQTGPGITEKRNEYLGRGSELSVQQVLVNLVGSKFFFAFCIYVVCCFSID